MDDSSHWSDLLWGDYSSDNLKPESTPKTHITDFSLTYPQPGFQLNFQQDSNISKNTIFNHKRTQSCNNTEAVQEIDTEKLLPSHIMKMIGKKKIHPDFNMYEKLLSENNEEGAKKILQLIIKDRAKNMKDQSGIYREAAEYNKRHFFNKTVSKMYKEAEDANPSDHQNYIDHAKFLDDIGETDETERVLRTGLERTKMSEQIMIKLIKQYERRQQYSEARKLFGYIFRKERLHSIYKELGDSTERNKYKSSINLNAINSIFECTLFEIRHGKIYKALSLFNETCKLTDPKPTIYADMVDTMRKRGYLKTSLRYARYAVDKFPNTQNNWISLIQLQTVNEEIKNILERAEQQFKINQNPKIEQTASLIYAKNNSIIECRRLLASCMVKSKLDQRWRLYYNAAIIEMNYGDSSLVSLLLYEAANITPSKPASTIRLSLAKILEVNDQIEEAFEAYASLAQSANSDWRTYLEFAMYFIRQKQKEKALQCTKDGLKLYSNNGRLWALRIQLEEEPSKIEVLEEGVRNAPKSGEVWTEAARIVLNPLSKYFNLKSARFFLNTAFLFTPQYIDIFIEMIRLEFLENGFKANLDKIREMFIGGDGNYGTVIYMFRKLGNEFTNTEFDEIVKGVKKDIQKHSKIYSRAIARSSFVLESTNVEEEKIRHDQASLHPDSFSFGLSSFWDVINDEIMSPIKSSVVFGVSGSFV